MDPFYKTAHRLADRLQPKLRRLFLAYIAEIESGADEQAFQSLVEQGDWRGALRSLGIAVPADARLTDPRSSSATSEIISALGATFLAMGFAAGAKMAADLGTEFEFSPKTIRAQTWASRRALEWTRDILTASREAVELAIEEGPTLGYPAGPLTRVILHDLIGQDARLAKAVLNFRQLLTEGSMEALTRRLDGATRRRLRAALRRGITEPEIRQFTEVYAGSLRSYKALSNARTLSIETVNAAQDEVWRQAIEQGKIDRTAEREWQVVPDDRLCPRCAAMAGQKRRIGEMFEDPITGARVPYPPLHPEGRCWLTLAAPEAKQMAA